jgi:hypothetical protein
VSIYISKMDSNEFQIKKYLIVNVKLPVRVNIDGTFSILENHSEIAVEPMTTLPEKTEHSIYGKLIEYIRENPSYLSSIVLDNEDLENENLENEDLDNEDLENEDLDNEDLENEDHTEITSSSVLHFFPYFKKSKKPLNTSFRNKGGKRNFTQKKYL